MVKKRVKRNREKKKKAKMEEMEKMVAIYGMEDDRPITLPDLTEEELDALIRKELDALGWTDMPLPQ